MVTGLGAWVLAAALNGAEPPLLCRVDGSDDHFLLHPHQERFRSARYRLFVLMDGLTLALVHRETGRFNRLTSLNLEPDPQAVQFFQGRCRPRP